MNNFYIITFDITVLISMLCFTPVFFSTKFMLFTYSTVY